MTFESWDDAMFWHGSLIGYMAGVKSACKDEDKSNLLLRMADTQARLEFMESENAKLRELVRGLLTGYECGRGELCEGCTWTGMEDPHEFRCPARVKARELGVEVEQ